MVFNRIQQGAAESHAPSRRFDAVFAEAREGALLTLVALESPSLTKPPHRGGFFHALKAPRRAAPLLEDIVNYHLISSLARLRSEELLAAAATPAFAPRAPRRADVAASGRARRTTRRPGDARSRRGARGVALTSMSSCAYAHGVCYNSVRLAGGWAPRNANLSTPPGPEGSNGM